jgi:hypothetical protein
MSDPVDATMNRSRFVGKAGPEAEAVKACKPTLGANPEETVRGLIDSGNEALWKALLGSPCAQREVVEVLIRLRAHRSRGERQCKQEG